MVPLPCNTHTTWSLLSTVAGDQFQEEGEVSFLITFHPVPQVLAKSLPEEVLLPSACSLESCSRGWAGEERPWGLPLWFIFPSPGAQAQSPLSQKPATHALELRGSLAHKPGGTWSADHADPPRSDASPVVLVHLLPTVLCSQIHLPKTLLVTRQTWPQRLQWFHNPSLGIQGHSQSVLFLLLTQNLSSFD